MEPMLIEPLYTFFFACTAIAIGVFIAVLIFGGDD